MSDTLQISDKDVTIPVRIVTKQRQSVLVEWGEFRRTYVPKQHVTKDSTVLLSILQECPPYGIQWEAFLSLDTITTERLALDLRKKGIWTQEDLKRKDRVLIRIATNLIGSIVQEAAKRAAKNKLPRSK